MENLYICSPVFQDVLCGCGVIGSRARLRIWCREAWGFESLHPHNGIPFRGAFVF